MDIRPYFGGFWWLVTGSEIEEKFGEGAHFLVRRSIMYQHYRFREHRSVLSEYHFSREEVEKIIKEILKRDNIDIKRGIFILDLPTRKVTISLSCTATGRQIYAVKRGDSP